MSFLKKLFGGSGEAAQTQAEPVEHKGFRIIAAPIKEGARYRIGARVEKEIDGETKVHQMIRADTIEGLTTASEVSVDKAKTMIDQLGDSIFS